MIVVMGTPGAGKTTVIREFLKRHSDVKVVNFGTVMFNIARDQYGVETRDDMRKLTRDVFRELQSRAAHEILKSSADIIDTHASVKTLDGYYPGFPYYLISNLDIDLFVYIIAPFKTIRLRRERDKCRKRDYETIDEIRFHENMNISFLTSYSTMANAPIKFILNDDGKLEQAVKEFEECVRL